MRISRFAMGVNLALLSLMTAACGGGGIESAPSPSPSPTPSPTPAPSPTPTPSPTSANTTLKDLRVSQSFSNDAASLSGNWDLVTETAIDGESATSEFSIRYNADTGAYSVAADGNTQSFANADVVADDETEVKYRKVAGAGTEYLTLVKTPYTGNSDPQYVGVGVWQRNLTNNGSQNVNYYTFTYGLPTAAAMVPRTGAAGYAVDVFGLVTKPGEEPLTFQGPGTFSVDFLEGRFTTTAYVTEHGLVTDFVYSGGGVELQAGGMLSAGDGSFSGQASYGSWHGWSSGTIAGQFYGPRGEEIGASFQTSGLEGLAAVGSLVGAHDASITPANQTLTHLASEQDFYTQGGGYTGHLTWLDAESFYYGAPRSEMVDGEFTTHDRIDGTGPNFAAYAKSADTGYDLQDVVLELYRVGPANTEIPLTYSTFGHWAGTTAGETQDYYFNYGFEASPGSLIRNGTARYAGVIYGTGANSDHSRKYDVRGTSNFNVDFSNQAFQGMLEVTGREQTTSAYADFGSYLVNGATSPSSPRFEGLVSHVSTDLGIFYGQFYGPDAQEMAGTFDFDAPAGTGEALGVRIQGATVTVRQ